MFSKSLRKLFLSLLAVVVLTLTATLGPVGTIKAQEPTPTEGPYVTSFFLAASWTDQGWNAAHWRGIQSLKELGELVEEENTSFTVKLDVPEYPQLKDRLLKVYTVTDVGYSGADIERVMESAIRSQNPDMIWATYWDSKEAAVVMSERHPELLVEQCSGYPVVAANDSNMATYFIAIEDGDYPAGYVAGRLGLSKIGLVATYPIPEPVRGINAFLLGLKRGRGEAGLDPEEAEVRVVWIMSWLDMPREKEATLALLAEGYMAIRQGPDTPTVSETACEQKGVVAFGYGTDVSHKAPCAALSDEWTWGPYYKRRTLEAMAGVWQPHNWYGAFAQDSSDDAVTLTGWNVPKDIQEAAEKVVDEIRNGFDVFSGPIVGHGLDAEGNVVDIFVPKGYKVGEMGRLTMQWLVEGVLSELPQYPPEGHNLYLEPIE